MPAVLFFLVEGFLRAILVGRRSVLGNRPHPGISILRRRYEITRPHGSPAEGSTMFLCIARSLLGQKRRRLAARLPQTFQRPFPPGAGEDPPIIQKLHQITGHQIHVGIGFGQNTRDLLDRDIGIDLPLLRRPHRCRPHDCREMGRPLAGRHRLLHRPRRCFGLLPGICALVRAPGWRRRLGRVMTPC